MKSYKVKYKVNNTTTIKTMQLQGGIESEAIEKLKKSGGLPKEGNVIILSIELK